MTKDEALALYRRCSSSGASRSAARSSTSRARSAASSTSTSARRRWASAAMSLLRPDDYFVTSYRDHGYALARGTDPRPLLAELCGKVTGISRGKGGSMHFYDVPARQLRRGRHRGRPPADRRGHGLRHPPARHRPGRALLLRRRRRQRGRLPRGAQRERALGPARRLHHREQPLRHGHLARPRLLGEGPLPARLAPTASPAAT